MEWLDELLVVAGLWCFITLAIAMGVEFGIKWALKDLNIPVNTIHRS